MQVFEQAYADRHAAARAWKARTGGKVVGYVGADVPEEIFVAAGLLPVRVSGDPTTSDAAVEAHVEATADPAVRSIAARLLDGTYDYLDHVVICASPAIYAALYGFLVEGRRLDADFRGPDAYLFDFFHSPLGTTDAFNAESLKLLCEATSAWAGRTISDADLFAAISAVNRKRRSLARLGELRAERRLTGVEALQVYAAAAAMPLEDFQFALEALIAEAAARAPLPGRPVAYSGSETETLEAYRQIEAAGALIVGDDQEWGGRAVTGLVDESLPALQALRLRYQFRAPQPANSLVDRRADYLLGLVERTGAQAVVFRILAIDHAASWEYPTLRKRLEAQGVASLDLGALPYRDADNESLRRHVSSLLADCGAQPVGVDA